MIYTTNLNYVIPDRINWSLYNTVYALAQNQERKNVVTAAFKIQNLFPGINNCGSDQALDVHNRIMTRFYGCFATSRELVEEWNPELIEDLKAIKTANALDFFDFDDYVCRVIAQNYCIVKNDTGELYVIRKP